jgi:hypothetical protein
MSFASNLFDHLGIGYNGKDALSSSSSSSSSSTTKYLSHDLLTKVAERRRLISSIVRWLQDNRVEKIWYSMDEICLYVDDGRVSDINSETRKVLREDLKKNTMIMFQETLPSSIASSTPKQKQAPYQSQSPCILFAYKPRHPSITDIESLHAAIVANFSLTEPDIQDSYPSVLTDVQLLVKSGKILRIFNKERKRYVLYDRRMELEPQPPMERDLVALWRDIVVPASEIDLLDSLEEQGLVTKTAYEICRQENRNKNISEKRGYDAERQEFLRRNRAKKTKEKKAAGSQVTNKHLQSNPDYQGLFENPPNK